MQLKLAIYTRALKVLLLFVTTTVVAQTNTEVFTVNGLKVILKQTQKETLVMSMYYRGGLNNYPDASAGIESLALSGAIDCGNSSFSAEKFDDQRDEYELHLTGDAANDYGLIKLRCITRYAEEGWKLFASAITSPVFEAGKFELLKQQKIDELKASLSSADVRLQRLAASFAFAGTAYANNPDGSVESLTGLTRDAVKDYYFKTLLNKNRMFLVVAGNISRAELETKVQAAFTGLPEKEYTPAEIPTVKFTQDTYKIESRAIATNYVCAILNAPNLSNADYPAFRIAVALLNSTLFREIRLAQHLSYAPAAYITRGKISYLTMYASTAQPRETVKAMYEVLSHVRGSVYTSETVSELQKSQLFTYLKQQEAMSNIADALGEAEIMGDWHLAENFDERVSSVTAKEVQRVLSDYTHNLTWVYLGDKALGVQSFAQ